MNLKFTRIYTDVALTSARKLADRHSESADLERRRALGQFFTPPVVARFMFDMVRVFRGRSFARTARIIDPACGEGVFLRTAVERGKIATSQLFGVDIDETLVPVWRKDTVLSGAHLHCANGLLDVPSIKLLPGAFDLVIGNPPFSGAGVKSLLRLLVAGREASRERDLFDSALRAELSAADSPLAAVERTKLDQLVRELSQYDCWRFRDDSDADSSNSTNGSSVQKGLFSDLKLSEERATPGVNYDRAARLIVDWPAERPLDTNRPDLRELVRRLASVAIEVFFVERFIRLAKPGGMVAVIVPESILASDQLKGLRRWLLERVRLFGVVSLPQHVFTGVGAKAKTGILFARRLTKAEERATRQLKPPGDAIRLLPKLAKCPVILVRPDLDWSDWTLDEYLQDILKKAMTAHCGDR